MNPRVPWPILAIAFTSALARPPAAAADAPPATAPRVVINEIMYHPPEERDEMQWVELWNPGAQDLDLTGWSFRKGLTYAFTNHVQLPAGKFLVVSRDHVAFRLRYGNEVRVVGDFEGHLSHNGERLELADAAGLTVDSVKYADAAPWPASPDGLSPSLERITPDGGGDDPANWAPSPLPPRLQPAGTPGLPNQAFRTNLPPIITDVSFTPGAPGTATRVTARIQDPDGLRSAQLIYRSRAFGNPGSAAATNSPTLPAVTVTLQRVDPTAADDRFAGEIPGQIEGTLVRFHLRAEDQTGMERLAPHADDLRPDWSVYFGRNPNDGRIASVSLIPDGPMEVAGPSLRTAFGPGARRGRGSPAAEPARGSSTLLYFPADPAAPPVVYDYIRITPRQAGWKLRLAKDQLLGGMSTVNVLFEYQPRFVLSEHLGYELFRAAGCPTPLSGHWRVTYNGRPLGYHLFVEQPNNSFLRRLGRDTDGELFKLIWYGRDLVEQHEKKNHPETGHAALVETVETLRSTKGEAQWQFIQERFNVDGFVNYYAVSFCLQNWDGFFNNHFLYRAPGARGQWEIIPWDLDKTWGDYDGASAKYDWYTMPITFGMDGDRPPRFTSGGPHGGPQWWRSPGWLSGPLLANPQFRTRCRNRVRELCDQVFTPGQLEPVIARLEQQLEPEVRFRAGVLHNGLPRDGGQFQNWIPESERSSGSPDTALAQFHRHIGSFRRQVEHRRAFLLRELPQ